MRKVLIGSHPKGYNEPFHPDTRSGKMLRKIIGKNSTYIFFDLWRDEDEQNTGCISEETSRDLEHYLKDGCQLIALGRITQKALTKHGLIHQHLPHPASRRKIDQDALKVGLQVD